MTTIKKPKKQKLRNAEYYDLQATFDKLYLESKNGKTFTKIMPIILSENNIRLAYRNLKRNSGSKTAGTDNKTIKDLETWKEPDLVRYVRKRLEWYIPQPVRRVEIAKDNGKTRPLGIPTIQDRLIQQCFLQVLEPICEAKFHDRSFGFRPNRSQENAVAVAYSLMQIQHLHFVVDLDIKGFFDNVSHGKLLRQMWSLGIRDKTVLSILSAMLKAEVAGIGFPEKGTPQGGIISPLLSNIVLNELDWWISSQWETMPMRKNYVRTRKDNGVAEKTYAYKVLREKSRLKECYGLRYADDFRIFCRRRQDAEKLFIATQKWLKERLGLDISPEKSQIVNLKRKYSEFLGFKMMVKPNGKSGSKTRYTVVSHVSEKRKKKIKKRASELVAKIKFPADKFEEHKFIMDYNSYVMGIHNYLLQHGDPRKPGLFGNWLFGQAYYEMQNRPEIEKIRQFTAPVCSGKVWQKQGTAIHSRAVCSAYILRPDPRTKAPAKKLVCIHPRRPCAGAQVIGKGQPFHSTLFDGTPSAERKHRVQR